MGPNFYVFVLLWKMEHWVAGNQTRCLAITVHSHGIFVCNTNVTSPYKLACGVGCGSLVSAEDPRSLKHSLLLALVFFEGKGRMILIDNKRHSGCKQCIQDASNAICLSKNQKEKKRL